MNTHVQKPSMNTYVQRSQAPSSEREKHLSCDLCDYRIHRNDLLRLHMNSKHDAEKFKCTVTSCSKIYSSYTTPPHPATYTSKYFLHQLISNNSQQDQTCKVAQAPILFWPEISSQRKYHTLLQYWTFEILDCIPIIFQCKAILGAEEIKMFGN